MNYKTGFKSNFWKILNNLFIFLSVASISINRRILIAKFSEIPHDYESIFLNFSDIVIILFLIYFLFYILLSKNIFLEFKNYIKYFKYPAYIGLVFLSFSGISVINSTIPILSLASFMRLSLMLLYSFSLGFLLINKGFLKKLLIYIVIFGVFNSLLASYQFFTFRSFGLSFLGEATLSLLPGVSKVSFPGALLVRGYGLFSHPNILGAYLFLCVMICAYLIEKIILIPQKIKTLKLFLAEGALILCVFGLMVSFSRSATIASLISLSIFYLIIFCSRKILKDGDFIKKIGSGEAWFGIISIILAIFIALFVLGDIILPRFQNINGSSALIDRLKYSEMAISAVVARPVFGVGIGSGVAYFLKNRTYSFFSFNNFWEFEPVHDLFLIIASEIGVLGLFFFLLLINYLLIKISKFIFKKPGNKPGLIFCLSVLSGNLMLGIFDHYFWDSRSGILIFWIAIAISFSLIHPEKQKKLQDIIL